MPAPTRPVPPPPLSGRENMRRAPEGVNGSPRPPRRKPALPPGLGLTADPVAGPAVAYAAAQPRDWSTAKGWGGLHAGLTALALHRDALLVAIAAAEQCPARTRAQEAQLAGDRARLRIAYAKMEALCWALGLDEQDAW